jgi:uncharacterized Ntn-hydrolase superfamily protein
MARMHTGKRELVVSGERRERMKHGNLPIKLALLLLSLFSVQAFGTFSICAVDTVTRRVGSAGASCIAGAIMLSDPLPDIGVIHTQANYLASNQDYAHNLMVQGKTPQQVVDGVVANDAQGNSSSRQYGVVDLVDNGRSAGFSGPGCQDYKNHLLGKTYAIQGNILLGREILDSMEARFLNTKGTLADKLMAALQGAKVPGADTRCKSYNKSTISAFLRVAKPDDPDNDFYLDLNVNTTNNNTDPIDVLQDQYDDWLATGSKQPFSLHPEGFQIRNHPNPFVNTTSISYYLPEKGDALFSVCSSAGRMIKRLSIKNQPAGEYSIVWDGTDNEGNTVIGGVYPAVLEMNGVRRTCKMLLMK